MLPTIVDTKVISPGASFLIVTACLVVVATGMKAAAPILVPFLLALFIALISAPPLLWLQDRGVPRGLALLIVISLQVGCCLVLAAVLTRSVNDFTQSMPEYQASMKQQVVYLVNALERWGIEPSIIAAVPAVVLALIQGGFELAMWATLGYVIVNVLVGNVVEPRVMGQGLGLSSLVVLLSMVFWGYILGPVGMLLSIPLTMMVKIGLEGNEKTRWVSILLGPEEDTS